MSFVRKENDIYSYYYRCIPSHCPFIGKLGKTPHQKAGQHGHSLKVRDKKTADAMAKELDRQFEELRRAVILNQPIPKAKVDFTLAEWAEQYFQQQRGKLKAATLITYTYTLDHLIKYLGPSRKLRTLDRADMDNYYRHCKDSSLAIGTLESRRAMLQSMFNDAVKREYLPTNTIEFLHKVKHRKSIKKPIDREKLEQAFAISDEPWSTLLLAAYLTGGRIGELLTLKRRWINRRDEYFTFVEPKEGDDKTLHLYPSLQACFDKAERMSGPVELVFTYKGQPITRNLAYHHIRKVGAQVGIGIDEHGEPQKPYLGPHVLRRSRINHLLEDGVATKEVMGLVGHKNLSTTEGYVHTDAKRQKDIAGKLSLSYAMRSGNAQAPSQAIDL